MIYHIVCTDKNGVIGVDNHLPWSKIPEDLKFFKDTTLNSIVIMGRKTFQSLNNKPLPKRINVIVSKTLSNPEDNSYIVFDTIEEAITYSEELGAVLNKNIFIMGGSQIYQETFDIIDGIYLNLLTVLENTSEPLYILTDLNKLSYYVNKERIKIYFNIEKSEEIPIARKYSKLTSYYLKRNI